MLIMAIPDSLSKDNKTCFLLRLLSDTSGFLLKEPTYNSLRLILSSFLPFLKQKDPP